MTDQTEITRICNRHMARLLHNLEEAGCAKIHRDAVRGEMQWLRADLLAELDRENELANPHDHW